MKNYTPLHVHSDYSLMDGLSQCYQIAERAEQIGATACAITDHGSISGAIEFSKEMAEKKLKPILGTELYICHKIETDKSVDNAKRSHQVVLAKNKDGWKDLLALISYCNHKDHFYSSPRISLESLPIFCRGNFISFSGHLGSVLADAIIEDGKVVSDWISRGTNMALQLQAMFGRGNFFIEVQLIDSLNNDLAKTVGLCMREIALITRIPCVATPDAHYPTKDRAIDQRVLICTSLKMTMEQAKKNIKNNKMISTFFNSDNYHIPTYDEMLAFHTEEELDNTNLIASMCDSYSILSSPNPPSFICPNGMTDDEYLRKLCLDGWKKKIKAEKGSETYDSYANRAKMELEVFKSIGLSSYFLIIEDIIKHVQSKGYLTGAGRGSAAGCLVSYLIGITKVDPIKYGLVFERFYNAGRNAPGKISWPDIDFDVPKFARAEAIEYIRNKYGASNVAQIITFQQLKGKSSLTRVFAAHGVSFEEQKAITKNLIDESKISDELGDIEEEYGYSSGILWALENMPHKLKEWCEMDKDGKLVGRYADMFSQAIRLEHTKILSGKHAAGIVVSKTQISDICPMVLDKDEENQLAGFDGPSCEDAGLLKLDCLGIRSLDKIQDAVKIAAGKDDLD